MKPFLRLIGVILSLATPVATQKPERIEPQVHNTVTLPHAAHKKGQTAGFFNDPITGNKVYRLSDEDLCPGGAIHFYSYTNQFSQQGRIVFDCMLGRGAPDQHPIYGPDFKLEYDDALDASHAPGSGNSFHDLQWSQEREVLYARSGGMVVELDPAVRKTRVVVNFVQRLHGFALKNGQKLLISGVKDLSVGPGDRLMVHLQCRFTSPSCPQDNAVIGIGVFDPATGQAHGIYVPVPGDKAPSGFDEGQWSQNPKGRLILVYGYAPNFSYTADLTSRVKFEDNHGHRGYFCGSNGRCYMVRVKNDTLPNGSTGQIGCKDADGKVAEPWRAEQGLYDDETGKRALIFGCDIPGQNAWQHFTRSLGGKDIFGVSTERYTFKPSLEKIAPTEEAIVRGVVEYADGQPSHVRLEPVAYHRSASGPRAKLMGRECGYWASPRVVGDSTGTRFLFESTMSHTEWPALEGKHPKTDCRTDVYVTEYAPKP
jgi:hypothetical protein